ncbi:hypothetical protein TRAPUB_8519 [Trametes pubescens]|uniref:Uncharacterized protein n=1 Tax=Trametes pubescens TaxID=154538 RepID=A0A1M2W516_TRAPU|nr:hypothetical protein TRAPUB_8519 [Trametes pubescens]
MTHDLLAVDSRSVGSVLGGIGVRTSDDAEDVRTSEQMTERDELLTHKRPLHASFPHLDLVTLVFTLLRHD